MARCQKEMIKDESCHLVLLEDHNQVFWMRDTRFYHPGMTLVAITADALQALEELNYPCSAVSDITDTKPLVPVEERYVKEIFSLSVEIENYLTGRIPEIRIDGPGFLSGNFYFLQYSVSSIAKRAYILREIIEAFSPSQVTAFRMDVVLWFKSYGYTSNPWDDVLDQFSKEYGFSLSFLQQPQKISARSLKEADKPLIERLVILFQSIRNRLSHLFIRSPGLNKRLKRSDGIRLLMNEHAKLYDWGPVLSILQQDEKNSVYELEQCMLHNHWWSRTFVPVVHQLSPPVRYTLSVRSDPPMSDPGEKVEKFFDEWASGRENPPEVIVLGFDLYPYLITQIKQLFLTGIGIVQGSDRVITEVLDKIQPDLVCVFNITQLSDRRLAYLCEKKGIPVLCYQHGFGYNFQIQPKDEGCDQVCAPYILSYGTGNNPRENPLFPVKSEYIPVGSARIEEMLQIPGQGTRERGAITIVWIADLSTGNTHVGTLTEDTRRYGIQKRCLELLSSIQDVKIVYRPLALQVSHDGTSRWVTNKNYAHMVVDAYTPLEELISTSDLVIIDASSPTTWGEVLGLKKPFILYCDPGQTPIKETGIPDLQKVCRWCRSEEELIDSIMDLSPDPRGFISKMESVDTDFFLKKYILHEGDCAERVCSFIVSLLRK